jgi:hypothetical protein
MRILSLLILCGLLVLLVSLNPQTESPHGTGFKVSCKTCHSPKGWQLDKKIYSFNHNKTNMPLVGQHSTVDCRQCHLTLVFKDAKTECNQCHTDIHQSTVGPDCQRCHTPASWLVNNINEIHQRSRFPLLGAHRTADCIQCHKSETLTRFDVNGVNCIDCHRDKYLATTSPNHVQSGISEDCSLCHPMNAFQWTGAGFDHKIFPLTQGHSTVNCTDCHTKGVNTKTDPDCYSCHQKDFLATKNPNHTLSKISTACKDCHTLSPGWKPTNFDHTVFPLKLGHSVPACIDCHTGGNYTSTSPDCYSCHQLDYTGTRNPNHVALGYAKTCQSCHTLTAGWKPASVDHSRFPLTLGHSAVTCAACHPGGVYTATPTDCYACHKQNYNATINPNHLTAGIPTTCETCHTVNPGWKPTKFNHTTFPLTLGHAIPTCADCHKGNYVTTSTNCYSCHQLDYTASKNPNHIAAGFSTNCGSCHTTNPGWKPAVYNHLTFPLTQGHATPVCTDCHKTGNYSTTSPVCYSCHQLDYTASTNPNHITAGFPTVCSTCHTLAPGWKPTSFNHSSFPLTQGHAVPTCADCHKGNYTSTSTNCYSCHQLDYTSSANPNHIAAGFPTTCATCHTLTPGWKPASFNHTTFPLTLGHATPTCAECHKGNYTNLSRDCYTCHQLDFTASTNPNHVTAGYPTTCATCHSTNPGWKPATFTHTTFPLTLGHATPTCVDCHKGSYTATSKDCYSCHLADYNNSTNPNHRTLALSTTCTQCHTTNPGWKPATYTQHDVLFPIYSGRHKGRWTLCTQCHVNTSNYAVFSCASCHSGAHRGSNYTPAQCLNCHPRG